MRSHICFDREYRGINTHDVERERERNEKIYVFKKTCTPCLWSEILCTVFVSLYLGIQVPASCLWSEILHRVCLLVCTVFVSLPAPCLWGVSVFNLLLHTFIIISFKQNKQVPNAKLKNNNTHCVYAIIGFTLQLIH